MDRKDVKAKKIYFLFAGFDMQMGGVGFSVVNRAKSLHDRGYDVTLLSADNIKNFEFIKSHYIREGIMDKDIPFINLFDFFSEKNTIGSIVQTPIEENDNLTIKKTLSSDESLHCDYYDGDELIKSEIYIDGALVYRKEGPKVDYFTQDKYNYLSRNGKNFILKNRGEDILEFAYGNPFLDYFIDEVCINGDKPIIVCDSTAHWYEIKKISRDDAYKIGSMHGNPYVLKDNERVINPKIKHFKYLNDLDAMVLLTEEVMEDLSAEFDYNHFVHIPNFVSDEYFTDKSIEKDLNRISIFSRISPEKQIADAIRAFGIVNSKKENARLDIYGRYLTDDEKAEHAKLKGLIDEMGLDDAVSFRGFLDDTRWEMQKSLATLLISKNEGLPLTLLESMASSTPVIAYDLKYGPKDVITDGVDGVIVPSGDVEELAGQMLELLENPDKAISMGKKACGKIKSQYNLDNVTSMWENLFCDICHCKEDDSKNVLDKVKGIFKF